MSRPWMPLYIGDYLRDTRRLSTVEHGAYLLLIMEYWTQGGLPDDDKKLARIAGLSGDEWAEIREAIADLFQDGWKHKRIDAELATAAEKSEVAREKANKRWQHKGDATADAAAMPQHPVGICPDDANHNHSHNQIKEKKEDSPKRVRTPYPEDFERFWDACAAWRGHSGKKEAADEWRKLSSEDKSAAMSGVGGYSASLKVPNAPTPLHVCRFLKYRRFEVYAGSVLPFSTPPPKPQYTDAELRERALDFDRRYKAGEFG